MNRKTTGAGRTWGEPAPDCNIGWSADLYEVCSGTTTEPWSDGNMGQWSIVRLLMLNHPKQKIMISPCRGLKLKTAWNKTSANPTLHLRLQGSGKPSQKAEAEDVQVINREANQPSWCLLKEKSAWTMPDGCFSKTLDDGVLTAESIFAPGSGKAVADGYVKNQRSLLWVTLFLTMKMATSRYI